MGMCLFVLLATPIGKRVELSIAAKIKFRNILTNQIF